jgi:inner membrane protein
MNVDTLVTPWLIWFIIGIGFAFLELMLPYFIVLFFGIGCLGVAAALLLWDLTLTQQFFVFIVTTISSLVLLRRWLMRIFSGVSSDKPSDDYDDFPYKERVTVLISIVPPNSGRIRHRGTAWNAVADEEIHAGETAEIIRYHGNSRQTFFVRKI